MVVSHDGFNEAAGWRSIIVVPLSTSARQAARGPTVVEFPAGYLPKASHAICHQITTVDRSKLSKRIGSLTARARAALDEGIKAALDLD